MICYATEFPVCGDKSVSDVLTVVLSWIADSPHNNIPHNKIEIPHDSGEIKYNFGKDCITVGTTANDVFAIGGVRWTQRDNKNLEWTTTIVANKDENNLLVSIQVACESLSTAALIPLPKKPLIINKIIRELHGGTDGYIPITDKPFILNSDEESIAAAIIQGTGNNRLPVIYISSNIDGTHIVDPAVIAQCSTGMAHVVVEPNIQFSKNLRNITAGRNVFGGWIGVYWPDDNMRKIYNCCDRMPTSDNISAGVINDIRIVLCNRRSSSNCSWLHLHEAISENSYKKLKYNNDVEISQLLEAAESEITTKLQRISEQEAEIQRLMHELKNSNSQLQSVGQILNYGEEQDLHSGEIRSLVIYALNQSLHSYLPDTRISHVLRDILACNEDNLHAITISSSIKQLLRSYNCLDAKTKSSLERLGFSFSEEGKHYKAVFRNDSRYTFSFPKSPSDHRSGKNLASDIIKKLSLH